MKQIMKLESELGRLERDTYAKINELKVIRREIRLAKLNNKPYALKERTVMRLKKELAECRAKKSIIRQELLSLSTQA